MGEEPDQLELPSFFQVSESRLYCPATGEWQYTHPKYQLTEAREHYEEQLREYNPSLSWRSVSITALLYLGGKLIVSLLGDDGGLETILNTSSLDNAVAWAFALGPLFVRAITDIPYKSQVLEAREEIKKALQFVIQYNNV